MTDIQKLLFYEKISLNKSPLFKSQKELAYEIRDFKGENYYSKNSLGSLQAFLSQIFKGKRPIPREMYEIILELTNKRLDREIYKEKVREQLYQLVEPNINQNRIGNSINVWNQLLSSQISNAGKIIFVSEYFIIPKDSELIENIFDRIYVQSSYSKTLHPSCTFHLFFGKELAGKQFWISLYDYMLKRIKDHNKVACELINLNNKILKVNIIEPAHTIHSRIIISSIGSQVLSGYFFNVDNFENQDIQNISQINNQELEKWIELVLDPVINDVKNRKSIEVVFQNIVENHQVNSHSNIGNNFQEELKFNPEPEHSNIININPKSRFEKELTRIISFTSQETLYFSSPCSEIYDMKVLEYAKHKGFLNKFNIDIEFRQFNNFREGTEIFDEKIGEGIYVMPRKLLTAEEMERTSAIAISSLFKGYEFISNQNSPYNPIGFNVSLEDLFTCFGQTDPQIYILEDEEAEFFTTKVGSFAKEIFGKKIRFSKNTVYTNTELFEPLLSNNNSLSVCTGPVMAKAIDEKLKRVLNINTLENYVEQHLKGKQQSKWLSIFRSICLHQTLNINIPEEMSKDSVFYDRIQRLSKLVYFTVDYIVENNADFINFLFEQENNSFSKFAIKLACQESYIFVPFEQQGTYYYGHNALYPIEMSSRQLIEKKGRSISEFHYSYLIREKNKLSDILKKLKTLLESIDNIDVNGTLKRESELIVKYADEAIDSYSYNPEIFRKANKHYHDLSRA